MSKIASSFAGAALVVLLAAVPALGQESITVLGLSLLDQCSNAAANAQRLGKADPADLQVCGDAIARSWSTESEIATAYRSRGALHLVRGEPSMAIADFTRALEADPAYAAAYNDRGVAFSALHRSAEATRDYTRALALKPENADQILFNRAMAYEDQGDLKRAYLDYRQAADLNPAWDLPAKQLARFTVATPGAT
jgi:tetratricopeptide (TPR) repeat protein